MRTVAEVEKELESVLKRIETLEDKKTKLVVERRNLVIEGNKEEIRNIIDILFKSTPQATIIPLGYIKGCYDGDRGVYGNSVGEDGYKELVDRISWRDTAIPVEAKEGSNTLGLISRLYDLVSLDLPDFNEDNGDEGINEYWYGFTALTKDYKLIYFNIRYDGWLGRKEDITNPSYNIHADYK